MGKLFGTDGIRGIAGVYPLDRDMVYRTGHCLTGYLQSLEPRPRIVIARDTRESGPWMEGLLRRAIEDAGGECEVAGVLSTPAVSLITTLTGAQAGVMISASHNPYQDNGIKIFSADGLKLSDDLEETLEQAIIASSLHAPLPGPEGEARPDLFAASRDEYVEMYSRWLRAALPAGFGLAGLRVVADCAHGSLSAIAPEFLRGLGAEVIPINCRPNGKNINLNAGALHLGGLQEEVRKTGATLGVAFDGDADRALFVDSDGRVRDGDDTLYLLACHTAFDSAPRVVVGTVMANLGLEVALEEQGVQLVRTAVGDRYVLEEMLRSGAIVGGEQSGHVILKRLACTGDGLLTALKVLEIMAARKSARSQLWSPLRRYPQVLLNVPVGEKKPFSEIPGLVEAEAECRRLLGGKARIILRYSGTEKLARVMVEGESQDTVTQAANRLAAVFQNGL